MPHPSLGTAVCCSACMMVAFKKQTTLQANLSQLFMLVVLQSSIQTAQEQTFLFHLLL